MLDDDLPRCWDDRCFIYGRLEQVQPAILKEAETFSRHRAFKHYEPQWSMIDHLREGLVGLRSNQIEKELMEQCLIVVIAWYSQ